VVDLNPRTIAELRDEGVPCIYGDIGNPHIMEAAQLERARVLALTCPDPIAQVSAADYARKVNPDIYIVARLADGSEAGPLERAGVSEVVEPAFEASLEFVRHTLGLYGVAGDEVEHRVCPFLEAHPARREEETRTHR